MTLEDRIGDIIYQALYFQGTNLTILNNFYEGGYEEEIIKGTIINPAC